ncbi:MAG: hypothetical protein Q8Q01_01550 [archaeon]|nr:hypothetical protein [archaeon]
MALKVPTSMDECLYFSNRSIDDGNVLAWVYRKECPKCKKDKMGKPIEKGKVKTRAIKYVCHSCGYEEEKKEHEESLTLEAKYTCPYCGKDGEGTTTYQRKSFKGAQAYLVDCEHCHQTIPITKKLKKLKVKKVKG